MCESSRQHHQFGLTPPTNSTIHKLSAASVCYSCGNSDGNKLIYKDLSLNLQERSKDSIPSSNSPVQARIFSLSHLHFNKNSQTAKILDIGATCDQLLTTMEDKSPSLCRLCDVKFDSPSEWRQHAKSDWQYASQFSQNEEQDV